jgi:hypothetical protein
VSGNWPGSKWQQLDDGTYTQPVVEVNGSPAFVELDFGAGGKETTQVRVVNIHPYSQYYYRLNGAKLIVMDDERNVMFSHIFSGVTSDTPIIFAFQPFRI